MFHRRKIEFRQRKESKWFCFWVNYLFTIYYYFIDLTVAFELPLSLHEIVKKSVEGCVIFIIIFFSTAVFSGNLVSLNRPKPVTIWNITPVDRKWHGWHRKCASHCSWRRLMFLFLFTEIYCSFFLLREKQYCIISSVV